MTPITVQATVEVPFERITNAIIGAIEGASTYWMDSFAPLPASETIRAELRADDKIWYVELPDLTNSQRAGSQAALGIIMGKPA